MATDRAAFLAQYTPPASTPWVTLTFAQSRDGKIAGKAGRPVRISGDESMLFTHEYVVTH